METVNKYLSTISSMPNSKKLIILLIAVVLIMLLIEVFSPKGLYKSVTNHSEKIEKLMNASGELDEEAEDDDEDEEAAEVKPKTKKIKLSSDKLNVTLYFAHWCGHCKQFIKESWGKLKKQYDDSEEVQLNEIDCTEVKSRIQTPGGNDIEGFPTLVFNYVDANGDLQEEEYKGGRTVKHVNDYINKMLKEMN